MPTMKHVATVCFTLLLSCSAFSLPRTSLTARQANLEQVTDMLLFDVSLATFEARDAAENPPELIWEDNGCTFAPDNPLGFDFFEACDRHDFGYRNYKAQGRFTATNRERIDQNFLKDLNNQCEKEGFIAETICKGLADVYYEAVRAFGGNNTLFTQLDV